MRQDRLTTSASTFPSVADVTAPPAVLLLHGLAASAASTWREAGWLDLLADAGRTVLAPDLPGHGATPMAPPPADPGLVAHVLGLLPDEPVQAIGFSLGARTLLTAAAEAPERFDRLVLAGVGERLLTPDDASAQMADAIDAGDEAHPMSRYFLDHARRSGTDAATISRILRHRWPALTSEVLARVTMPVLVVAGDRDPAAGDPGVLAGALPDGRAITLRNTDHFATPKSFDFIDAALDFLGAH
jgi:pimeloyl-ACP methyl ester carboxylesterase